MNLWRHEIEQNSNNIVVSNLEKNVCKDKLLRHKILRTILFSRKLKVYVLAKISRKVIIRFEIGIHVL